MKKVKTFYNDYISDLVDISKMEIEEARILIKEGLKKHEL